MNVLRKIKHIIQGCWYKLFKNIQVEKLAARRMDICMKCPLFDSEGKNCAVPGTQPCCGDCGCSLSAATRSPDYSCPKNKW